MTIAQNNDTICALSTAGGIGAIAVIRLSGNFAFKIVSKVFNGNSKIPFEKFESHSAHYGSIVDGEEILDEVVVTVFKNPHSYTGEDVLEISCHGSIYIQQQLLQLLVKNGARTAQPGEFTMRAFLNGKMDLSRAEAVADLIASGSKAAHKLAMQQMRGGFSNELKGLREKLVNFASLIELELDFSEEDVEFADRKELTTLLNQIQETITKLTDSFAVGNVIKNGIPVAIAGAPNVGKSTLLNALLNEERAIVSEIPGTTRDFIEDTITIDGMLFRFIDTAGIRDSEDKIEKLGISKTFEKIGQATVVLYVFDTNTASVEKVQQAMNELPVDEKSNGLLRTQVIPVINKIDESEDWKSTYDGLEHAIFISAKNRENIEQIKLTLSGIVSARSLEQSDTVVTNLRHYEALSKAGESIAAVAAGLENKISGDLLAIDIRATLHHLAEITGEVTTDELLGNIFGRFCIGK